MKRITAILLALIFIAAGVDLARWWTGRVPVANLVYRAAAGAPEASLNGQRLMYRGTFPIGLANLKPAGRTDAGATIYRVKDWPDGMGGGWLYIPQSDHVSYRYSTATPPYAM